jgi:hypothetical protein
MRQRRARDIITAVLIPALHVLCVCSSSDIAGATASAKR